MSFNPAQPTQLKINGFDGEMYYKNWGIILSITFQGNVTAAYKFNDLGGCEIEWLDVTDKNGKPVEGDHAGYKTMFDIQVNILMVNDDYIKSKCEINCYKAKVKLLHEKLRGLNQEIRNVLNSMDSLNKNIEKQEKFVESLKMEQNENGSH